MMQRDMDLRGVSANPAATPSRASARTHGTGEQEQDILSQMQPIPPSTARPSSHAHPVSRFSSDWSLPRTYTRKSGLMLSSALPVVSTNGSTYSGQYLAIGRQVWDELDLWECRWGHDSDGTESISSHTGEGTICPEPYGSLSLLKEHYQIAHGQFHEAKPPFMWKCKLCHFKNDRQQFCPHCSRAHFEWEKWYFGYVSAKDNVASPPTSSAYVSNPDSVFGTSPSSSFSGQGRYHSRYPSFSNSWNSTGSGPGASFFRRLMGEPDTDFGCHRLLSPISRSTLAPSPKTSSLVAVTLSLVSMYGLVSAWMSGRGLDGLCLHLPVMAVIRGRVVGAC